MLKKRKINSEKMTTSQMSDNGVNVAIPITAREIVITNILSPYFIRALDAVEDGQRERKLNHLLQKICKSYFTKKGDRSYQPQVNHHVVIKNVSELPSWFCRGTVVNTHEKTADVLLVDYGIVMNLSNESLVRYPESAVPIEPISFSFGLYNIVPLDSEKNICNEWPKDTVVLLKGLIQTAKKLYLEILAHDNNTDRIFGDLYLVIDGRNISISKFFIESHMAVALNDEVMKAVQNGESDGNICLKSTYKKANNNVMHHPSMNFENENSFSKSCRNVSNSKKVEVLDKILIHSKISCQPLEHLADSRLATTIHKALKDNGVTKLKQIQSHMLPAINQGLNVTVIAPTVSGKTLGYIIPIINAIAANEKMLEKQKSDIGTKPFVLVLCATLKTCINVTEAFSIVAKNNKNIRCCAFFSGMNDKDLMTRICNKFQVMVSTPSFLLKLLAKSFASDLNLSELSYLILDHADVILQKNLKEVITLIKDYKVINKDFENCIQNGSPQTIIVARTWTSEIDSFMSNFMENPYTCIRSFTEAAAYNGVQGRMLIRHSDKKKYDVLGAIKHYTTQKTIIFCLDTAEACELNQFLLANGIQTLLVHNDMTITQIQDLTKDLKKCLPGSFPAIVCTDDILSEFPVSDVEYLIHYSVTNTSKTQFNRRFSVLMDNWMMEVDKKCKILILFDETKDSVHFKGVVDILKRFKVDLPEDWNAIADGLEIQDNLIKKNYPLCNNLKSFGYCNTSQTCPDRHRVIAETDAPDIPEISIGDELKLLVTYIHSVTHYTARILECRKKDKKVVTLPLNPAVTLKLKTFYSKVENRIAPQEIMPGLICVAKNGESYTRVRVLKIVEINNRTNKPRTVKIQSLDDGNIRERATTSELFEISDEFLSYKLPIVNVYLTGVAPFDEENDWGILANQSAKAWFDINIKNKFEQFVWAKALLHIGDSIWTDSLVFRNKILGYGELVSTSLKKVMIEEGHAIENNKHLPYLTRLCITSGMTEINGHKLELSNDEEEHKE